MLVDDLRGALDAPGDDLATPALLLARLEYPRLDPAPYLARLAEMGAQATVRLEGLRGARERVLALSGYLFGALGFTGNRQQYVDPRNSFLNDVLERRLGIPITLSIVYLEVGRRAGLPLRGVAFPGHFLVRCEADAGERGEDPGPLVIDPFNGGTLLSELECLALLRAQAGEEAAWDPSLLEPTDRLRIVLRMLNNLKRAYVALRSFSHARRVTDLLVALDPGSITELRDRGLLAYHLEDFSPALRDLERYLQLMSRGVEPPVSAGGSPDRERPAQAAESPAQSEARQEFETIWEHVKNLRRRVASFN